MVLDSTRPRGADEDPDRVLASPARWSVLALSGFVAAIGAALSAASAFAPLREGETRSALAVVGFAQLAVMGAAGVVVFSAPRRRRPLPAPVLHDGGVALPMRTSYRVARVLVLAALASFGVTVAALSDDATLRVVAVLVGLVLAVFAALAVRATHPVRLDPVGVALAGDLRPQERIAWGDVADVAAVGGWLPHLVMTWDGPGLSFCRIGPQGWPPSAMVAVIEHYRTHPEERDRLVDPAVLDRFRQ